MSTTTDNKAKEVHDKILAGRLTIFRKEHIHKSQNKAAELLGIPQSNLSYMESGRIPIRYDFIAKLVKYFSLNQDWFTTGNGDPIDKNPTKPTLLTDINALNVELVELKRQIRFLELHQNHMLKMIEELQGKGKKQ